jgi:aspartyl-tRNA(Asn)/glutamyl-tRNA(Gln) amidotransferase subunit A
MTDEWHARTAVELGAAIERGDIDPVDLTDYFLARIAERDPDHLVYLRLTPDRARAEATAARERAKAGSRRGPLDGVPISWKDIYDSAGTATTMGTPLMADRVPDRDAKVLARATQAGLVCLGKTNTVQFALGGLGLNTHTGTPPNAAATDTPRAPGGSSCGAAVSAASGLAPAAIGSDTGGSVRIPAAWNGLVGLKTSFGALPTEGVMALAPSLDTVGPLTKSVADATHLFAVMADEAPVDLSGARLDDCTFLVSESVVWDGADTEIADAVRAGIERLAAAGARVEWGAVPEFDEIDHVLNTIGGTVTSEGYATWKELIDAHPDQIDDFVLARFLQGRDMSAENIGIVEAAARDQAQALYERMAGYSAILAPTVPIVPPPIEQVSAGPDAYQASNMKALRNTRLGNVLPCCALTLPCPGPMPAGLMLMGPPGADGALLRIGAAAEPVLRG